MLHLHREESYKISENATTKEIIEAESARRTFWILESQEHLYIEYNGAVAFPLSDISALLPSSEEEFAFGKVPEVRSALAGTEAANRNPDLVSLPSRTIFATVVQAHNLWGQVARRAGRVARCEHEKADEVINKPWERKSNYLQLTQTLRDWEKSLPAQHHWSVWNFRGYKATFLERPYVSQVIVTRLSNIIIRRIYLDDILDFVLGRLRSDCPDPKFWSNMAFELYSNVRDLHDIFDTVCNLRLEGEDYPAILVFSIYICGSLAAYLFKWPQLCPLLASSAEPILNRSLEILGMLLPNWPIIQRWLDALQRIASPMRSQSQEEEQGLGGLNNYHFEPGLSFPSASPHPDGDLHPLPLRLN
ncbi:hypothetical protein BP5796_04319 [Coleophoma crateriformis]|uniref:Transcription factor domain-containing protein n=1 Tax=Coleophoma crateriformis TaxID=565419 RepID=A0A3D8SII5_9HELO|nr:hypothetical protein BP5796_04319 [Coleophoma crateriformis]